MNIKTLVVVLISAVCILWTSDAFAQDKKKQTETVYFYVAEMTCKNCQATVEKNISFERGVTKLSCDWPTRMVAVTYRTDRTTIQKLTQAFNKIKMPAKVVPSPPKKNK